MISQIASEDLKKIEAAIHKKFSRVAVSPEGQFKYPTGKNALRQLNYEDSLIERLPDEVIAGYCGVGNPFSLGEIQQGQNVLDVGCGAGVDTFFAAILVGPAGSSVGVDLVPEMISRAKKNQQLLNLDNVGFQIFSGENLPFPDGSFDVVISNGVINLIPDKQAALTEIARVLKPFGRVMLADQISAGNIEKDLSVRLANWFQ
jgi:SAM-dependent methyltransferase